MGTRPPAAGRGAHRRGRRFGSLAAVVAALAAAVSVLVSPAPVTAGDGFDPSFPRLAVINYTDCKPTCATGDPFWTDTTPTIHFVDPARRAVYGYQALDGPGDFPRGVAVVDTDRMTQSRWIDLSGTKLPSDRFGVAAYDAASHMLFVGEKGYALGCTPNGKTTGLEPCGKPGRLAAIDLSTDNPKPVVFSLPTTPPLTTTGAVPESAVGDTVTGITVDAERQRLYVLTTSGSGFSLPGLDPRPVSVVAYDTSSLSTSAQPLWTYRVRACGNPLEQRNGSTFFDAVEDGSAIYFACRGVSGSTVPHGVLLVHLHESTTADPTAGFDPEFVPFGGDLTNGFATGDPANDRIGIGVSGASGQRLYIYDARNRGWVASILLGDGNVGGGGADSGSGRFYVFSASEGIRAVDAAALPAILGKMIGVNHAPGNRKDLVVDPVTRRVFEPGSGFLPLNGGTVHPNAHMWVFEDRTEAYNPPPPANPDDATNDIEEALAQQVSHTGSGSAYGARLMWVGGLTSVPVLGGVNDGIPAEFESLKFSSGDRGMYVSQVSRAELSGESDRGEAAAEAVAAAMDDATADDLSAKFGQITTRIPGGGESKPCDPSKPGRECLEFDALTGNVGQLKSSTCTDFGGADDRRTDERPGSTVACTRLDKVSAWASGAARAEPAVPVAPPATDQVTRQLPYPPPATPPTPSTNVTYTIADSHSKVEVEKDPEFGVRTVATSVASGVEVAVAGVGSLHIGEIRSVATTWAAGRVGSARSTLDALAKNVRIADTAGKTLFSCGVTGVDSKNTDDGEQCEPTEIASAVNRYFAPHLVASGPRQDRRVVTTGSPGGAQAIVIKDQYSFWNDVNVNGDARREVVGLELTTYHDTNQASRLKLQLAAVYAESQYQIGELRPDIILEPAKLSIKLVDGQRNPLAGGAFQVRKPSLDAALPGDLLAACRTANDGIGDCTFDDLEPGSYVVSELAAPVGYAPAPDTTVSVQPGFHTTAEFTNLRAVGSIAISLRTEDATPLAGATFELLADNGDLTRGTGDQSVGTCSTELDGRCGFADVPLGKYVVHQSLAPPGYLVVDDAGFELSQPGQRAELSFTTGVEGSPASGEETPPTPSEPVETARVDEPTETTVVDLRSPERAPQVIVRTVPMKPRTFIQRVAALPAEVAQFLRRKPGEAVLFALVWILLGSPLYLATRRRSLTLAKVSI